VFAPYFDEDGDALDAIFARIGRFRTSQNFARHRADLALLSVTAPHSMKIFGCSNIISGFFEKLPGTAR
jgi:hypothetical protein